MLFRPACLTLVAAISVFVQCVAGAADSPPPAPSPGRIEKGAAAEQTGASEPAKLLADIAAFRSKSASLPDDRAATEWLTLWDRARALAPGRAGSDPSAFDVEAGSIVGLRSVIAALPQPSAWPALRKHAVARAKSKPDDPSALGLRLIMEMLAGDKEAVFSSLSAFERSANSVHALNNARAIAYKLYGSREQIADAFAARVDAQVEDHGMPLDVPDLVGLVGAARAEALLREALRKPVSLRVPAGEATRNLARKLALSEVAALRKPQWGLIDGVGTASLYEAMDKRFDPGLIRRWLSLWFRQPGFDYTRQEADTYYFLDLVIAGRHQDAERAMARIGGDGSSLSIPRQAMAALVRGGKNEAVYEFLAKVLERRPELQGWDAYLEQAGYLGRGKDAIALIDRILKRSDLPLHLRADLRRRRLDALLAADQVDAALAGFRELLSAPPTRDDARVMDRAKAAVRLAALGRILKQPKLAETGFGFAQRAVELPAGARDYSRTEVIVSLLAELRRQGRAAEAQAIAQAEVGRASADASDARFAAFVADPAKRAALAELAGIYDSAGRSSDVLRLFDDAGAWGARDLLAIIGEKDSLGTPLGMMAARAFKAGGDPAAARSVVRVLLDRLPGHDPAYQMFVELSGGQAAAELDRLYALDQFEERPLIWKAIALKATGKFGEAEKTIRRAIAIDPSDGEQGQNDRMRAYGTLADILEARGDANSARLYRRAVAAIRLSEQADELHKLGLYQRAFARYRAALAEFSDAYCIQSRLAVQLSKQGLHDEALKHYRRAYELMPDSFGRVESHCFGCESVFADSNAQTVAEQVFTDMVKSAPGKPQAHYMLGYLRKEQGRYGDALVLFRHSVNLDAQYLNAWKNLHELGGKTYMEAWERDIARLKLFELDPRQRHVRYELDEVVDFTSLWRALDRTARNRELNPKFAEVYPLKGSAREQDQKLAKLPPEMRVHMERIADLQARMGGSARGIGTTPSLARHALLVAVLELMGDH